MKIHNQFSEKQFGFLDGWSTELQLLAVLDKWTQIIDGRSIDYILWFQKGIWQSPPPKNTEESGNLMPWKEKY